jgi:hypothetical protein
MNTYVHLKIPLRKAQFCHSCSVVQHVGLGWHCHRCVPRMRLGSERRTRRGMGTGGTGRASAAHAELTSQLSDLFMTLRLSDKLPAAVAWCIEQVKHATGACLQRWQAPPAPHAATGTACPHHRATDCVPASSHQPISRPLLILLPRLSTPLVHRNRAPTTSTICTVNQTPPHWHPISVSACP